MAVVTSESDIEFEDTQFLEDLTTTNGKLSSTRKYNLPNSRRLRVRCLPLVITFLCVLSISLLAALIVVATRSHTRQTTAEKITEEPTTPTSERPSSTLPATKEHFVWNEIRLPGDIVPTDYVVNVHPDLASETVEGNVVIEVKVNQTTNVVIVHARDMNITYSTVQDSNGTDITYETPFFVKSTQFYVMKLDGVLNGGTTARLVFHWQSRLSVGLAGFYRSKYRSKDGKTHVIATTQFEATDARAAFPCFDEPAMKAHFNISIVYDPRQHKVQSNMPTWWNETLSGGLVRAHFMKSPKMSTYLVAFIVSDFDFVETTTRSNITVRVWARPDLINQTSWALYCGSLIIDYYEEFFGIQYPLPKQDLVAIPDFAAGAMENWGLITYRETDLLFDPQTSSSANRQRVAVVIAHELAHQWFGNLVTMKWWNNLWLNEGFASYVEYVGTERVASCLEHGNSESGCTEYTGTDVVPSGWHMHDQFFIDTVEYAYSIDSLASSHPIDVTVETPADISSVFDAISYDKGASILQMLYEFIGKEDFLQGLNSYLNAHAYSNAETGDLLDALDNATTLDDGLTVADIMSTWTEQIGFPVVNVEVVSNGHTIMLHQKHFLLNQTSIPPPSKYNYIWSIPITYRTDTMDGTSKIHWLNKMTTEIPLGNSNIKWIKVNVNQTGYYRVNYTVDKWNELSFQLRLNHLVFSPRDRAGLIADAFAFSRASQLDLTVALQTIQYLGNEQHYVPWTAALSDLVYIGNMLATSPVLGKFKAFMCQLLQPVADYLGWEVGINDTHIERRLRGEILYLGWQYDCLYQNISMMQKARSIFSDFMNKNTRIPPDLHRAVYGAGVAHGGENEWEFIWKLFQTTDVPNEKRACLRALAETKQPWILSRFLEYSIDETKIRTQDSVSVIAYVSFNPLGRHLAWDFVRRQWDSLFAKFSDGSFSFGRMIRYVANYFNTNFEMEEFKAFFSHRESGAGASEVSHALEKIKSNIRWLRDNEMVMDTWLTTFLQSVHNRQRS